MNSLQKGKPMNKKKECNKDNASEIKHKPCFINDGFKARNAIDESKISAPFTKKDLTVCHAGWGPASWPHLVEEDSSEER